MTVPYVITLLPTYVAVARVGLYDTLTGVIVPAIGHCGFVVFFLRQAFKSLPRELWIEIEKMSAIGVARSQR